MESQEGKLYLQNLRLKLIAKYMFLQNYKSPILALVLTVVKSDDKVPGLVISSAEQIFKFSIKTANFF